jgi:hypothetical protein
MTSCFERLITRDKGKMGSRTLGFYLLTFVCLLPAGVGCRQKMADQPYYRPYEPTDSFADGRSNRPLERGVIHRAQYLESDPLVTGLTAEEWARAHAQQVNPKVDLGAPTPVENREVTIGAPRYDPREAGQTKVYVDEFPFPITENDLKRGQERYTIYCAVCHGAVGNGQGKIWERGYLTPTSFHTRKVSESEIDVRNPTDVPLGIRVATQSGGSRFLSAKHQSATTSK